MSEASKRTRPAICLEFPLRPDFLAQVVVPRDLTELEVRRLCAFLMTLVQEATR